MFLEQWCFCARDGLSRQPANAKAAGFPVSAPLL